MHVQNIHQQFRLYLSAYVVKQRKLKTACLHKCYQSKAPQTGHLKMSGVIRRECTPFRGLPLDGFSVHRPPSLMRGPIFRIDRLFEHRLHLCLGSLLVVLQDLLAILTTGCLLHYCSSLF